MSLMQPEIEHMNALKMAVRKLLHSEDADFVEQGVRVVRTIPEDLIPSAALLLQVPKWPRKRCASAKHEIYDPDEDKENVLRPKRSSTHASTHDKAEQESKSKSNEHAMIKVFQLQDELAMSKKLYDKERELRSLVCHEEQI